MRQPCSLLAQTSFFIGFEPFHVRFEPYPGPVVHALASREVDFCEHGPMDRKSVKSCATVAFMRQKAGQYHFQTRSSTGFTSQLLDRICVTGKDKSIVKSQDERKEVTKISLLYEPRQRFHVVAYKHTGELTQSSKENWETSAGVDFIMPMKHGEITPADMERIAGVLEQGHVSPELTQKSKAYFQGIWHAEPLEDASRSTFHRVFPPADHT